jgi:hypothetical protein
MTSATQDLAAVPLAALMFCLFALVQGLRTRKGKTAPG